MRVKQEKDAVRVILNQGKAKLFEKKFAAKPIDGAFDYLAFAAGAGRSLDRRAGRRRSKRPASKAMHKRSSRKAPCRPKSTAVLRELNFFSQFSAIRQLHAIARSSGESPQMLGALVRGYANLGQLTNFHWNATHKVCKARALLYAQRLVRLDHASASALWHRAYAEALVGLHTAALADLKAARELADKSARRLQTGYR